ncbi:hypothetical protein EDD17DRAFT_1561129 [Pisolithus thermaeus]|nr:hypothetical protein EDD17DRAFT_1561129 [Pisolithus thermaeus]
MLPTDVLPERSATQLLTEPYSTEPTVILRTVDNVDFRFYKLLLSLASPFFANMFALPQPPPLDSSADQMKYGLPIIPVSESSVILRKLLSFCSPIYDTDVPALESLDIVMSYDMKRVGKFVVNMIVAPHFLEKEPMRVFAIACRYRAEEETTIAARYMLRFAVWEPTYVAELDFISGSDYQRLVKYHADCGQAMTQLMRLWYNLSSPSVGLQVLQKARHLSIVAERVPRFCHRGLAYPPLCRNTIKARVDRYHGSERAPRKLAEYAKDLATPVEQIISEVCSLCITSTTTSSGNFR